MGLAQLNETNIANSVALVLAAKLLEDGYLLYWHRIDAVQTPDAWYPEYTANQASYKADPVFAARLAESRGLMTLKDETAANPEYPVRPTSDGTVPAQDEVAVPQLIVDVGESTPGSLLGLGSRERERFRHLAICGFTRSNSESIWLRERLAVWFDEGEWVDIQDHESGTLETVGSVEFTMIMAQSAVVALGADAQQFEVILNARLCYVA